MSEDFSWFDQFNNSSIWSEFREEPVAYFSAEYGLWSDAPLYAGGLGVLAGDHLREMSDRGFPYAALGLCYWSAYGMKQDRVPTGEWPKEFGFEIVLGEDGSPLLTSIPIDGREVYFQAWKWQSGKGALYLFDTRVKNNSQDDQAICDILYAEDRDMRLRQEILLGIGGMRFLRALGIHPSVYHLNEGHSAFLAFELVAHEMKHRGVDFTTACKFARQHIAFTNHTLVPAGNEIFATDVVTRMLQGFADKSNIQINDLLSLGYIEEARLFSMTKFALAMSARSNAVSKLHAAKAIEQWGSGPATSITNGIHINSWDVTLSDDATRIRQVHQMNKSKLIDVIREKTGRVFDSNTLLLGWARRLVPYKQPLALFADLARFKDLATREGKKIQVVYAGPLVGGTAHYNEFLERLTTLADTELRDILVFLPDYDLDLAKLMVSGCDVWLNTPIIGSEACGTSGMKAALNGSLPLTTNDGWVPEANLSEIGWVINDTDPTKALLDTLQDKIIPIYYIDHKDGDESEWSTRMLRGRGLIKMQFSATRMLREYIELIYIPTLRNKAHQ